MSLQRFRIISEKDDGQPMGDGSELVLLNTDHIISLKPINMVIDGQVFEGYWIRMSNGKKYRATEVPEDIKVLAEE